MKYHFEIKQNTEDWENIRIGKITASKAAELLMPGTTKGYKKLIAKIFEEQLTKSKSESETFAGNKFTERGHQFEPIAISDFEMSSFEDVKPVGFVSLDEWVGCSPDGLINNDGLIQIKCPIFNTQIDYLETKEIPTNYYKQMQFELFVCEDRKYNIFYSYHPKLPAVEIKIERDEEMIAEIKNKIIIAKTEITEKIKKYI